MTFCEKEMHSCCDSVIWISCFL